MRTAISGLARSIWSKVEPLIDSSVTSLKARAVAVRGRSSRIAISPKKSPFSRTASGTDSPPCTRLEISTLPSCTMNISVPRSPSSKITSPAFELDG